MVPLRKLWSYWVGYMEARARYHRDDARQIAANNLRTLKKVTLLTVLLLALFLLATPCIIPGWQPTVWHVAFLPVSVVLTVVTLLYARTGSSNMATALCVAYEVVLFAAIIAIDVPGTPNAPGSFLSMLCVIMPVLFTMPFLLTFALILLAVAAFSVLAAAVKPASVWQYDIFEAVVAVFFALAVDALTTALRIRDYEARMKYKLLSTRDAFSDILNKRACKVPARTASSGISTPAPRKRDAPFLSSIWTISNRSTTQRDIWWGMPCCAAWETCSRRRSAPQTSSAALGAMNSSCWPKA